MQTLEHSGGDEPTATGPRGEADEPEADARSRRGDGPQTLAIDVGATGLKAAVLDAAGTKISDRVRVRTPHPCPPPLLLQTLGDLVAPLPSFDRVSVGFPGMVRAGRVLSAPNLSRPGPSAKTSAEVARAWGDVDLAGALADLLEAPVRVVNDAEMQGAAVVRGEGLELAVTLGTGFGIGLFLDGQLAPHLELGQHPFRKGKTYDQYLGDAARRRIGTDRWNRRLTRAVHMLDVLLRYDKLFVGGGNSRRVTVDLGPKVELIDNISGILGGIRLWDLPSAAATAEADGTGGARRTRSDLGTTASPRNR